MPQNRLRGLCWSEHLETGIVIFLLIFDWNQIKSFIVLAVLRRRLKVYMAYIRVTAPADSTALFEAMLQPSEPLATLRPIWPALDLNHRPPAPKINAYRSTNRHVPILDWKQCNLAFKRLRSLHSAVATGGHAFPNDCLCPPFWFTRNPAFQDNWQWWKKGLITC